MDEIQQYSLIYTQEAMQDILDKADYIAYELHDERQAQVWYQRLREFLQKNLSSLPYKYPTYQEEPWKTKGLRLLTTRNDVVVYSVDEQHSTVYIRAVCTKGRDITAHLSSQI
jgi:toxin ParE1/3/4